MKKVGAKNIGAVGCQPMQSKCEGLVGTTTVRQMQRVEVYHHHGSVLYCFVGMFVHNSYGIGAIQNVTNSYVDSYGIGAI